MTTTKVVDLSAFRKKSVTPSEPTGNVSLPETQDLSDTTIIKFLRVCDYFRTLSDDSVTTITIDEDRLELETRHYADAEEGSEEGSVQMSNVLCLTSSMVLPDNGKFDTEDFREAVDHLIIEEE